MSIIVWDAGKSGSVSAGDGYGRQPAQDVINGTEICTEKKKER